MTSAKWQRLRELTLTIIAVLSAFGAVWQHVDSSYVHKTELMFAMDSLKTDIKNVQSSVNKMSDNIDSISLRLTQFKCGSKIINGCR